MKKGLTRRILACALVVAMAVTPVAAPNNETYGASGYEGQPMYSLANSYYKIKSVSNGKYLVGNKAGYEAQGTSFEKGMTFYMKPSALGQYIFYDSDSKYLTHNAFAAIVRTTGLGDNVKWDIVQYDDGTCSIYNVVKKQYVCISGTSLKWKKAVDKSCLFIFEETTGNNPYPEADVCLSITDEDGNEVPLMEAMKKFAVGEDIIGYADTHAHLNHNLGSGKVTFNGMSFSPLGILDALKDCTDKHGVNGVYDLWGQIVDGASSHNTYGYPNFEYWPTAYSTNHIQTYYKWLERSYLSGQRLLVHQCVNNSTLGGVTNALPPYAGAETNDMVIAREQIANIYEMQDYIDAQYGGPGCGWFRVVTSAEEARQVISEGKMAVLLSLELDTLFNCDVDFIGLYHAGAITEEKMNEGLAGIEAQIDEFYDLGVRSMFPVHALNNGFGGCQLYQGEIFSIMNYLNRKDFYQPEAALNLRVRYKQPKADIDESVLGHQNSIGLTETGEWLIRKLIEKKIVIEVDHMSDKCFNAVLDICWEEKYPGIIASHTRILDMFDLESTDTQSFWEQLDIPRMIKVMQLGGIVSPMLWETITSHQMCVSDYLQFMIDLSAEGVVTAEPLENEAYSQFGGPYYVPTTWYNMNGNEKDNLINGIPYGSDVNGACMLPFFYDKERFGYVDYDGGFTALNAEAYADEVANVVYSAQTTGNRTFDINGDRGVAHYGLVPDLLAKFATRPDVVNLSATFNSAEAYIRMFERMENYSDTYPCRDEEYWLNVETEYWHTNK